jgi:large subunit ribosomal protein L25
MDFAKVSVSLRPTSGKGPARRSRASGQVPGVLYGHKAPPLSVSLDPAALLSSLDKDKKRNTVFSLSLSGGEKTEEVTAMIRDVQIHPLSRKLVHVDFIRVSLDDELKVTVPLVLTGTAVGVTNGGNLHQGWHALPVAAKPGSIPNKIEIDVSSLDIGDAFHVSDLKLPAGVRVLLAAKEGIASVVAPRAEKEEVKVTAEGAAGAEGAPAGAEGATAAAGDKGAAGAAAAAAPAAKKEGGEKKGK